ncbi:hypothetical protein CSKR_108645 [Clonorchis sinensis]|uniref:Uncharacterized protein n=1 Tax=Clonorchis sinensis TaxID=79923 RepID=A0A3R7FKE1_CLOSI|nr:hypothetical protein CSKR_108645 [Clonorchis sinensis]
MTDDITSIAGQFDCKHFIISRGDIISALLGGVVVRSDGLVVGTTTTLPNNALIMPPRLVMKRLQSNCPAQRTSQRQVIVYVSERETWQHQRSGPRKTFLVNKVQKNYFQLSKNLILIGNGE